MSRRKKRAEKFTLADVVDFAGKEALVQYPRKGHGWAGPGWYVHSGEYPDEGSLFLGNAGDIARLLQAALRQLAIFDPPRSEAASE